MRPRAMHRGALGGAGTRTPHAIGAGRAVWAAMALVWRVF